MILFLTDIGEPRRGGVEDNIRLLRFFEERYHDVSSSHPEITDDMIRSPLKHARFKLDFTRKISPDLAVVDLSAAFRNILAVRWLKRRNKKIMTLFLGQRMSFRYNRAIFEKGIRLFERYLLKNSDIVFVNSDFTANLARRKGAVNGEIVVVRPGMEKISADFDIRENAGRFRQRPPVLLYVGACTKVKGLKFLVDALAGIRRLDFKLIVAGEFNTADDYYKDINDIINRGGIRDKVHFLGFVPSKNLNSLYKDASIFIMPSLSEGYGRALAEAISFGLPIIASDAGAISELVEDGVNGILVEPGNPDTLGKAIVELISEPEKMEKMGLQNAERAKNLQTWEMYINDLEMKLVPVIERIAGISPKIKLGEDVN